MLSEFGITGKQAFRYVLLPGILPRFRRFAGKGFHNLALLIAVIFNTVRILPDNHPYLKPDAFGTFGIRHAIAEAANHIVLSRRNIDQVVIFFSILAGLVLLVFQFFLIVFSLLTTQAFAASMPTKYEEFFTTPHPDKDVAFRLLDMVFGVPDFFNSGVPVGTPLHQALHTLLEFYSFGLLIVGVFIILYFITTIVAETAQTGVPFGKRFNHVWAPIRLTIFFALLIPITSGLNGGQYVLLGAVKLGSGLATTGWLKFNESLTVTPAGNKEKLIAAPNTPEMAYLPAFMMIAKTCAVSYERLPPGAESKHSIDAYVVGADGVAQTLGDLNILDFTSKTKGGDVHILFGEKSPVHKNRPGQILPYCGKLVISTTGISEPGAAQVQQGYYDLVKCLWTGEGECSDFKLKEHAENFSKKYMFNVAPRDPDAPIPGLEYKKSTVTKIQDDVQKLVDKAIKNTGQRRKLDSRRQDQGAGMGRRRNLVQQNRTTKRRVCHRCRQPADGSPAPGYCRISKSQKESRQKEQRRPRSGRIA